MILLLLQMEDLESKINEELSTLKEQLSNIDANVVKFTNVEDMKREAEEKRNRLIMEQGDLSERKAQLKIQVAKLQGECDQLEVGLDFYLSSDVMLKLVYFRQNLIKMRLTQLFTRLTRNCG